MRPGDHVQRALDMLARDARYEVTVKWAGGYREVVVEAGSAEEAVSKVRATLSGEEKRWASVFVG